MAINRQDDLPNNHAMAIGGSGCGKTTLIRSLDVVKKAKQLICYDPYGDYEKIGVTNYDKPHDFIRACVEAHKQNKGFRIGYKPTNNVEANLQLVAFVAWHLSDGKRPITSIFEEAGTAFRNARANNGSIGEVISAGRGFALSAVFATQRITEIPSTVRGNCKHRYFFRQSERNDIERTAKTVGQLAENIAQLKIGEHYYMADGLVGAEFKKAKKI